MEETRKIVVEIIDGNNKTSGGQTTIVNNETSNVEVNMTAILHPIKETENHLLGKSVLLNQAYGVAKSGIKQGINLTMNRYFAMKEDYINQTNFDNFMTGVSKVANMGSSIIGGAIVGSKVGGIAGAVAGGTIGAIGFGVSEYLGYQGRMSSYYQQLNASNYQTGFARTRAGLTDGGRGTDN